MNWKLNLNLAFIFLLPMTMSGLSIAQEIGPYSSSNDAFTIKVDLPQAVVYDLTIKDTLPQGLIYRSSSLEVIGTEGSPSETISFPNDGSQPVTITWSFGQIDNYADRDILLSFQPIVADVVANQDGKTLGANHVSLQFTDDSGEVYTASGETASVMLVEPDLEIKLSSSSDGGKTVTYSAFIGHTSKSHADAFGSDLSILLPAGTIYSPGSAEIVSASPGVLDDTNLQELKWHFYEIERSWCKDHMILLKFQANTTVENGANPGEIKATLGWKSTPEDNPGTRSYTSSQSLPVPAYIPSYSLEINQVAEPDPVEAGQSLLYTINYANTGPDDLHGVTIEEAYDRNVTYLSAIPMPDADRENLWTIGDLKAGGSGTIKLVARVNPDSADGTMLKNSVKMSCGELETSEATTETMVKGKSDKPTTEAPSNRTNTFLIENENITASQDNLQNDTENASAAMLFLNDTKDYLVSINQNNATEITNTTTSKSDLAINQSATLMNQTSEAEDLIAEAGNQFETDGDLLGGAVNQNETADISSEPLDEVKAFEQVELNAENDIDTKDDPVSIRQNTDAELTNTTLKSDLAVNQNVALTNPTTETEDSRAESGSQFEIGGDLLGEAVNQNETADKSSETLDEVKAFEQVELNVKNDIYTISFSDKIRIDIVFDKSNPMMEKTYVVLNETAEGSNYGDFNSIDLKNAALSNTTSDSGTVTNQTYIEINKTKEIKILQGNESEKGIGVLIVSDNETVMSSDPLIAVYGASGEPEKSPLPVDSESNQALNQTADDENLQASPQSQPAAEDYLKTVSVDTAVAVEGALDEQEKSLLPVDSESDLAINQPADDENLQASPQLQPVAGDYLQTVSVDPAVVVEGALDEQEKSLLPVDSESDLAINQTADDENLQASSQLQPAAEENPRVVSANQYTLESIELSLVPSINETEVMNASN